MPPEGFKETEIGLIPKDWDLLNLGELCNFETGKLNSNMAQKDGIYPFFTCSPETLSISSYSFDCEAILLAGNNAEGKFNVKHYNGKFDVYQRTYVINIKNLGKLDYFYLYFILILSLDRLRESSQGTATKFLTMKILNSKEIPIPPIEEQRKIGQILSSLDQKIELNHKMNKTLEEIAQTIFRHWFVHYEFPDENDQPYKSSGGEMIESKIGLIPKNWKCKSIGELCDVKGGKRLPKGQSLVKYKTNHPYIRVTDLTTQGIKLNDLEYLKEDIYQEIKRYIITKDDVYISIVGTIGLVGLVPEDLDGANLTENCAKLTNLRKIKKELLATFLKSYNGQEQIKALTVGSTQGKLALYRIKEIRIALPTDEIFLEKIQSILSSIWLIRSHNQKQNQILSKIRDSILPKLMSGRIRVKGSD